MQYIPIKTRRLTPPQDDLFSVLGESLTNVQEHDVLLVTSKVVGIHQGRCVLKSQVDKRELILHEADALLPESDGLFPITLKYHGFSVAAGIDSSNAGEYFSLLPEKPFDAAHEIWRYITDTFSVKKYGVIITDSYVKPMRSGVVGTAIGWWGIHPIESHRGKKDLFGEPIKFSATNIVDALAAGGAAVCGESGESTPLVVIKNVPNLDFTHLDTRHELFKAKKDDIYYQLLKPFWEQ